MKFTSLRTRWPGDIRYDSKTKHETDDAAMLQNQKFDSSSIVSFDTLSTAETLPVSISTLQNDRINFTRQVKDNESVVDDRTLQSKFLPHDMRCLALVSHNNMKVAMKSFIFENKQILKKFRLTGTSSTMTILKSVYGDDDTVVFGPEFKSGPLGGDAQVGSLMCTEDLGGIFFFMDPLSAHPHEADISSLIRLANVYNVPLMTNLSSASAFIHTLKHALLSGNCELIPSFFCTLESPTVQRYRKSQSIMIEESIEK